MMKKILLVATLFAFTMNTSYANPKTQKERTAQECKVYTDKIDGQIPILEKRHRDLLEDPLGLYANHNATRNKNAISGSYQGHIKQYNIQQGLLKQYITEALLAKCDKFISAKARKWSETPAPTKPNRST